MRAAVPHYMRDLEQTPPGHRFGLYFKGWADDWILADKEKQNALGGVAMLTGTDHQHLSALIARQQVQAESLGDAVFATVAQSTAPFVTGMGYEHPLENGFAFLNPYGLPYLPGSSIKGVLRDAAREIGIEQSTIDMLFGPENAGDNARRGALNFWDAFPDGKLTVEIMTPHHSDYLQKGGTPHDSEKPNPIPFLAVASGAKFHFFVQQIGDAGDCDWRAVLAQCFAHAWDWLGFGAKTAVGYGAMRHDARAEQEAKAERERLNAERKKALAAMEEKKRRAAMSPIERELVPILAQGETAIGPLLQGLKDGKWEGDDAVVVARKLKTLMEGNGSWLPNFTGKNKQKKKKHERTLEVMRFLGDG